MERRNNQLKELPQQFDKATFDSDQQSFSQAVQSNSFQKLKVENKLSNIVYNIIDTL